MRRLTEQNIRVLRALADIQRETGGFQPTVREIGTRVDLASPSSVQFHVDKLCEFGLVVRKGTRRAITPAGFSVLDERLVA